jgi:hypothetical protein
MEPYQDRVLNEKAELDSRLARLQAFLNRPTFNELAIDEQERLRRQAAVMQEYSEILAARIEHF